MIKVSLITATFNSQDSIMSAIKSVNEQTYPNIEHIFVDGKSMDETLKIIKSMSTREHIIKSETDQGIYDALNKGIELATGDIIGFLHSDDIFADKNVLSDIVEGIMKYEVDGIYGDLEYVYRNDPHKIIRSWKSCIYQPKLLSNGWMPPHPTLFLKRTVYKEVGLFDLVFKIAADYDYVIKIFKSPNAYKIHYLPRTVTKMSIGGASNKSLANLIVKSKEDLRALRKNGIRYPNYVLLRKNLSKLPQFFLRY